MKKKWEFKYDEEIFDTLGSNFVGVITDGDHSLFFHALPEPGLENEICHIFSSITDLFCHENQELSYPWTKENDDLLLEALNSLEEGSDRYYGENSIFHEFFAAGDLGNP